MSDTPAAPKTSTREITVSDSRNAYPAVSRLLHWLVAGGIILQFVLGERAEEAAEAGDLLGQLAALAQHKSIGITILGLALLRVLWRLLPSAQLAAHTDDPVTIGDRLAKAMHIALYVLLFFLPVSGWLMSSASGYSVSWFNLVQLPDLISANDSTKELLQTLHNGAGKLLFVLAVGHILAALKHWLIDKDGVMGRMGSPAGTLAFIATIVAGVAYTWPNNTPQASSQTAPISAPIIATTTAPIAVPKEEQSTPPTEQPTAVHSDPAIANTTDTLPMTEQPPRWILHDEHSHIRFTAQQAGADFTGEWEEFTADIRFAADNLENSSATIQIDAGQYETNDEERNEILAGLDWFDSENFTTIVFEATEFSRTDTGFSTTANLKLRGASYPVEFNFSVSSDQGLHRLKGRSRLDRLALNLGTMEWLDTEWIGQFVDVEVEVQADTYEAFAEEGFTEGD